MSGVAEAGLVISLITGILDLIKTTRAIYDSVNDGEGLPEAFREVGVRLAVVTDILKKAEILMGNPDIDTDTCKALEGVFKDCAAKAKQLNEIFDKVVPSDSEPRIRRYWKAARAVGKGGRVEDLMKQILESLDLAANSLHFEEAIKTTLKTTIKEVSMISPSLPDAFEETTGKYNNYGSGPQNISTGSSQQTNNTNTGTIGNQYIGGQGGTQNFQST